MSKFSILLFFLGLATCQQSFKPGYTFEQIEAEATKFYTNTDEVIFQCKDPLDATRQSNLHQPTNFGELFTRAMALSSRNTSYGAIINANDFQIDETFDKNIKTSFMFCGER